MIRNKCGKLKLGNLVLASHIFPVIKFLLSHSTQLLNSNIQKHEKKKWEKIKMVEGEERKGERQDSFKCYGMERTLGSSLKWKIFLSQGLTIIPTLRVGGLFIFAVWWQFKRRTCIYLFGGELISRTIQTMILNLE